MKTMIKTSAILCASMISSQAALSVLPTEYWQFNGDYTAEVDNATNAGSLITTGTGSATFVAGLFGEAIDLNSAAGSNDAWVSVLDLDATFDLGNDVGTFSLWFTLDSYNETWQALLSGGEAAEFRISRDNNGAALSVDLANGVRLTTPDLATGNTVWNHLAFSTDGANGTQIWFNGNRTANGSRRDIASNTEPFTIGNNADNLGRGWNGKIDDVAFWDTALTDADVQQIWNSGNGASIASLIPEPSSTALLGLGGLALILRRRR